MRFFSYFIILFCTFTACQPKSESAHARTRLFDKSKDKSLFVSVSYCDTNSAENRRIIERLDSFYRIQIHKGFNGSVLIGKSGKVLYERYFGYARREHGMQLSSDIASQLASTSKTFTGAAIMYLHQHNYLNIDDPVSTYLSNFPYPNITLRMLLSHRSGLSDYQRWGKPYITNQFSILNNDELVKIFINKKPPLESRPGTRFTYCNSNYALLACIVEKVTEMKFRDFMREYIFEPLGMAHTFVYDYSFAMPSNTAQTYRYNWALWPLSFADGVVGDKNVFSTTEDMFRWDQSFYLNKLLNSEILEEAYMPCSFERPGIKNYGLGWRMLCFPNGNKVIYHNGWWHGNNTAFYRIIKENLTFIVLGNKFNEGIYQQPKVLYSIVKNVPVADGFEGDY